MIKIIHPDFELLEGDLLCAIGRFDDDDAGVVVYKARNTIKVFDIFHRAVNIKRYRRPALFNRFVYTFIRKPKALRAYINSCRLLSRGFPTPRPIACIVRKRRGLIDLSYYISEQQSFSRNMYEFGSGGLVGREEIVRAFTRFTAALHEAGITHLDYSPGNILFEIIDGSPAFCLVDTNRMSIRSGAVGIRSGCANFARLWGQDEMFEFIAREYAEARCADVNDCRRWVFRYRRAFWNRYAKKHKVPFRLES
ncbi:MAG: lipopolysaccharide kinase InaA family protein [Tannerellaceae bacterium]|jgi:serine/threonine protein kinase|nr:lipopolysaccharide kinase InaA family protein [Tannerellaceae bacterium]